MHRIGIVGSGPAAFYTALKLLKSNSAIKVDMFEKLPVPFGLVRYGVAPDHPEVKNVITTFTQVAQHRHFRFFGNVTVGHDISIAEMRQSYDAVVLAYGAAVDKRLGIPGENLRQVYSATDIVGWYNGLPEKENFQPDLSGEEAVIVGHGNVALDILRILLSPLDTLRKTDTPDYVISQLSSSRLKRIHLVGRRGPLQVAFTIKEFRELSRLRGVSSKIIVPKSVILSAGELDNLPRPRRRLTNLIMEVIKNDQIKVSDDADKEWQLHFLRSPKEVLSEDSQNVSALRFGINRLQGDDVSDSGESVDMPCQMVVRSIGYRSVQIDPSIPFDTRLNVIPNVKGRVMDSDQGDSVTHSSMYCVGWIKRGPVGVIINTLTDAHETSDTILRDLEQQKLSMAARLDIDHVLQLKGIKVVSFSNWEAIDRLETSLGHQKGKPRDKLTSVHNLMTAALKDKAD